MGNNVGQSAGMRQREGAWQATVSPSTALPPREGKGLTAPPPHPLPFMIIISLGWLGLTVATGLMAQWLDGLNSLMA
jgi:hypothetical protein